MAKLIIITTLVRVPRAMRKRYLLSKLIVVALMSLHLFSCSNPDDKLVRVSKHGGSSHNAGQDCTQFGCHDDRSNIEFSYAGTVFLNASTSGASNETIPNATVYFYEIDGSGNVVNGASAIRIEVDGSGNFYSTNDIRISYPTNRPCFYNPLDSATYCMPDESDLNMTYSTTADQVNSHSCSNPGCHLNNRINPDTLHLFNGTGAING